MKSIHKKLVIFLLCLISSLSLVPELFAYEIKEVPVEIEENFVLQPSKVEVKLKPGETTEKEITITNRTSGEKIFNVKVEDFSGSDDPSKTVIILGDERGPYSLKDYLKPEVDEFVLKPKEQIRFKVKVELPSDATPGGLFGTVLISSGNQVNTENGESSGTTIVSELASLFFVRVEGDVVEEGTLEDFRISGTQGFWREKAPEDFEILFRNKGNVYLNPYGYIEIKNLFGMKVAELEVQPYFSLPDSLRARKIFWQGGNMFGKYTATVYLNRGYENIVDEKSTTFWVIPLKTIGIIFVIVFGILCIGRWFLSKYQITRK